MTTETINPKRLGGACRECSLWITEEECNELEALIERERAAYLEKDEVPPTRQEMWRIGALDRVKRALDEGKRYPALIEDKAA